MEKVQAKTGRSAVKRHLNKVPALNLITKKIKKLTMENKTYNIPIINITLLAIWNMRVTINKEDKG